jgi:outer membrane lipoprotein SlyB
MKGRGVTAGEAAKVGAGAVVGGIAGRLIGGNKKGTAIGAVAGAAAGAGIAAATRDVDIILPAGARIRIVLTAPFTLEEIAG